MFILSPSMLDRGDYTFFQIMFGMTLYYIVK